MFPLDFPGQARALALRGLSQSESNLNKFESSWATVFHTFPFCQPSLIILIISPRYLTTSSAKLNFLWGRKHFSPDFTKHNVVKDVKAGSQRSCRVSKLVVLIKQQSCVTVQSCVIELEKLQSTTYQNQVLVLVIELILFSSGCTWECAKHAKVRSTFKVKHNTASFF